MNDDRSDLDALASAYLDDEVTADERARVEADPALVTRVEHMRAVRALLADAEPAPISRRESHLAAALAAWDRIPDAERTGALRDATPRDVDAKAAAGAAAVTAPTRPSDRRRRGSTRWLTAAAAVLAVVTIGGVAVRLAGSADDDGSDQPMSAEVSPADEAADGGADRASEEDAATMAAESQLAADTGEAESVPAPGATIDTGINDAAPPREEGSIVLESTEDLLDYARAAADAPSSPNVPAATSAPVDDGDLTAAEQRAAELDLPSCGFDLIVGPAVYGDVPVVVGIDRSRDLVIAARIDDCIGVARVELP